MSDTNDQSVSLNLVTEIVCAFLSNNSISNNQIPDLITSVHHTLMNVGEKAPETLEPAVPSRLCYLVRDTLVAEAVRAGQVGPRSVGGTVRRRSLAAGWALLRSGLSPPILCQLVLALTAPGYKPKSGRGCSTSGHAPTTDIRAAMSAFAVIRSGSRHKAEVPTRFACGCF